VSTRKTRYHIKTSGLWEYENGQQFEQFVHFVGFFKQESPAIADKAARRESMPKLLQFDVLTTLSLIILANFIRLAVVASEICEIPRNSLKI